jgi:hypothetical protein
LRQVEALDRDDIAQCGQGCRVGAISNRGNEQAQ